MPQIQWSSYTLMDWTWLLMKEIMDTCGTHEDVFLLKTISKYD